MVDLGCGSQPYRSIFVSRGMTYCGADFSEGDVRIDDRGRAALPDSCADLVVSFQVLEHVSDVGRYLAEVRRLLRDDGRLLLSTHGNWLYHPHPEDHRRWTRQGLIAELATYGFENTDCIPLVGPLAWTTMLRLTGASYFLQRVPAIGRVLASALALAMNGRAWVEDRLTPERITRENACVYLTVSRVAGRESA